jgi:hypothetical protein
VGSGEIIFVLPDFQIISGFGGVELDGMGEISGMM